MSKTRWLAFDDTHSSITYQGDWVTVQDSFSGSGTYGPTYGGSQHATTGTASLAFPFTGSQLRVYGTSNVRNVSGTLTPRWECFVDGVSIGIDRPITTTSQNNYPLCSTFNQTFARHTLTVNVTAADQWTFYVDSIRYLPLGNLTSELSHPTVIVDQLDTSITYSPQDQWQEVAGTEDVTLTLEPGSTMSVNFTGSKVTWMGWTPDGYPTGQSTAQYKLDDAAPVTFSLRGLSGATTLFNQPFFETPSVTKGNHQLTVTHMGTSAPLVLDYLLVEDGDIIFGNGHTTTSTSSSRPTGTSTSPPGATSDGASTSSSGKKFPVGAVVGGAVGGIVAITVLLFVILFLRRKRAKAKSVPHSLPPPAPSMYQSVPSYGPSHPPYGTPIIQETPAIVPLSTGHASTLSGGSQTHQHSLSNPTSAYPYGDGSEHAHQLPQRLEPVRKTSPDPLPSAHPQNIFAASTGDTSDSLVPPPGTRGIFIPNSPNVIY